VTKYTGRLPDNGIPTDSLVREPDFNSIGYLYFDLAGRLWVDDRGWLDYADPENPIWYRVIRSPAFLTDASRPESQYGWTRPFSMLQSSNGQYWFSSIAGMVRLDPGTGEWCKFTTGYGPISEDDAHTLWIAVFDKLFKYPLTP
jgi:hypothetical protein